jgi:UDP-N-acetyl-D-mannosaminuronic acid dehydrogenase
VELTDLREAINKADIIVALVSHRQFKRVDRELLKPKIIIDTCGTWR